MHNLKRSHVKMVRTPMTICLPVTTVPYAGSPLLVKNPRFSHANTHFTRLVSENGSLSVCTVPRADYLCFPNRKQKFTEKMSQDEDSMDQDQLTALWAFCKRGRLY